MYQAKMPINTKFTSRNSALGSLPGIRQRLCQSIQVKLFKSQANLVILRLNCISSTSLCSFNCTSKIQYQLMTCLTMLRLASLTNYIGSTQVHISKHEGYILLPKNR